MKRLRHAHICACIAVLAGLFSACGEKTGVDGNLKLSAETVDLTPEGATAVVSLFAPQKWSASTSDSWLSVSPDQGEAGTFSLTIAAGKNDSDADRSGSVTVSAGSLEPVSVKVTQKAAGAEPKPEPDPLENNSTVQDWNEGEDTEYHKES